MGGSFSSGVGPVLGASGDPADLIPWFHGRWKKWWNGVLFDRGNLGENSSKTAFCTHLEFYEPKVPKKKSSSARPRFDFWTSLSTFRWEERSVAWEDLLWRFRACGRANVELMSHGLEYLVRTWKSRSNSLRDSRSTHTHEAATLLSIGQNHKRGWVKTLYPCSSHKNSWDLWMFIPLKMVFIGIDPYPKKVQKPRQ